MVVCERYNVAEERQERSQRCQFVTGTVRQGLFKFTINLCQKICGKHFGESCGSIRYVSLVFPKEV